MFEDEHMGREGGGEPDLESIDLEAVEKLLEWARTKMLQSPKKEEAPAVEEPAASVEEPGEEAPPDEFSDEMPPEDEEDPVPTVIESVLLPGKGASDHKKPLDHKKPVPKKRFGS